jgi:hypothetical protein
VSALRAFTAGWYEQDGDEPDGWRRITLSRHSRRNLAERAARSYLRRLQSPTGGAYSWSAWWREGDGPEHEITRYPRVVEEL